MIAYVLPLVLGLTAGAPGAHDPDPVMLPAPAAAGAETCRTRDYAVLGRNPTEEELRCRFAVRGPGRFGLLSYVDLPVYQPATPMPGTHLVGVPGHARPHLGESYEQWEWRVLRTEYGPEADRVHRELEPLDPRVAARILTLERRLAEEGVRAVRRETWRSPQRQAYLFQQGRSRPGPLATATLTSWHAQVDTNGNPAGRAVDYDMATADLPRFHEIAAEVGLDTFGADSHDPWHVFLPDEDLPRQEIVLLRTLPRVPEVTLATGLPVDQVLPAGGRETLRARAEAFARMAFIPYPEPDVSATGARLILQPVAVVPSGVLAAGDLSRPASLRPVDGGGRGGPPTGGGTGAAESCRSRGD